jgi:hypothetical protein
MLSLRLCVFAFNLYLFSVEWKICVFKRIKRKGAETQREHLENQIFIFWNSKALFPHSACYNNKLFFTTETTEGTEKALMIQNPNCRFVSSGLSLCPL